MVAAQGPAGPRRRLGAELRRLRTKAGLHLDDVAEQLTCSTSKISRLETGKGIPKLPDVRELMRIYGVTSDTERDMLIRLVRDSREQGWWEPYTEGVQPERFVMDSPGRYPALETEAARVRAFNATALHGLVQTPEYAREIMTEFLQHNGPAEIERLVELRAHRQRALRRRESPLYLSVVLDEGLLNRLVGGPEVMAGQLGHILELAALSNVEVRVLPFDAGFHRALAGQFTILEFSGALHDIVYIEGHAGDSYLDGDADVKLYQDVHSDVVGRALGPAASIELISRYRHRLTSEKGLR
ncbi:helix-turn-helix domain-containing protein [Pseudonocardia bannensis]|uniref:Helix-turn-helix domain-containing protein n=1 Tax=Pseudonocardia bannensis TaxID=630973 RepID=A0A848DDH3_9PSEU|nr:helix-turn-helix transcriptional regulator [Pseudonocardia bannensis]NMH90622.1 helix-turn-helix domain-containing protein [Pseudonocardia bannensis]